MSDARGSTGGGGKGRFGGARFDDPPARSPGRGVRRGRPNLWRSPLGAVAVAVAATAYWSTVAWLVAARTSAALIEVDNVGLVDEMELGLGDSYDRYDRYDNDGTGRLPPVMGPDNCPHPEWFERHGLLDGPERLDRASGFRPFSFGLQELGLGRGGVGMTLLDRRD